MELISKEDIEEFLVNTSKEFSLYTTFIHKFMIDMENYKECNITLDIKNNTSSNLERKIVFTQYEAWSKHFQSKGG
jgi:hypothetical protein